jgi:hypothetical protein
MNDAAYHAHRSVQSKSRNFKGHEMAFERRFLWTVIPGLALLLGGCMAARLGSSRMTSGGYGGPGARSPAPQGQAAHAPRDEGRAVSVARTGLAATAADEPTTGTTPVLNLAVLSDSERDRYLIKNATVTIEARDVRKASTALVAAVRAARGYLADTHESVDELGRRSIVIEARVPFGRFDRSLQEIEALGKVLEKQVTAEDVTEEFVDSQATLRNLQQTESRLLAHLNRTGRLADTLLVEKELTRVRGEIERLEGRLRFLSHRVLFSTLTVTISEAPRPEPIVPAQSYSSGQQLSEAVRSLVAFGQLLWTGAIWFGIWSAVWAPLALAGWLVYRRRRTAATG